MAKEVQEGILVGTEYSGSKIVPKYILSDTLIETMDLISEGEIQGPVSGRWTFSGTLGQTGWSNATFTPFISPTGFTGVGWLNSIFWNQMPVINEVGQFNFQDVDVVYTNGLPNGALLQTLTPLQTISRTIGERLYGGAGVLNSYAKLYRIINKDCQGCVINIRFPQLVYTNPSNGNIEDASVQYTIQYRPIFSDSNDEVGFNTPISETVNGKVLDGFINSTRVDFDTSYLQNPNFFCWEVKIIRLSSESNSSYLVNETYVDSLTELYGNLYSYPNSAIFRSNFNAQFFTQVPSRSYLCELKKVKIPGNYDPVMRTYATTGFATTNGGWNGEFATGKYYTNNPAWCFYDLLTNYNYGVGRYIETFDVDKFQLYEIAQYCDVLVADGRGGLEPRFTSNVILNNRNDAYKIINDYASIFRGLVYYANGTIYANQDAPKDAIVSFTNANVLEGDFTYSTSSRKTRNTVAIVRYNDPFNFYQPALEYVEDFQGIRRYGVREIELTAFGCTSIGQAERLGRWALLSNNTEVETVSFTAGMEGTYLRPGQVFKAFDKNRVGQRNGGRTLSINNIHNTGTQIVLDNIINLEPDIQYTLSLLTPSYNYNTSQVTGLTSNDVSNIGRSFLQTFNFSGFQSYSSGVSSIVNLYQPVNSTSYNISGNPIWVLELGLQYEGYTGIDNFINPQYDYYRVINITEKDTTQYEIVGLQYNPDKFNLIESGSQLVEQQAQVNNFPDSPHNLVLNTFTDLSNNVIINYSFLVDNLTNVTNYNVYAANGGFPNGGIPSNDFLITSLPSDRMSSSFTVDETGTYFVSVYAFNNVQNLVSPSYASGSIEIDQVDDITNIIISSLQVESFSGIYVGSPTTNNISIIESTDVNPTYNWQVGILGNVTLPNDLMYRATVRQISQDVTLVPDIRIPSPIILSEVTGILPNLGLYQWQFPLVDNIALAGGPYRDYQIVIEAHNSDGNTSAGNVCGQPDNGTWNQFPWGYDTLIFDNPRQTGIELNNNLPTQDNPTGAFIAYTGNYQSMQSLNNNGDVIITFNSGIFNADLVGGFIYIYSGQFPKSANIESSFWGNLVQKTQFQFNPSYPSIYQPFAASSLQGLTTGYISISFYDSIDASLLSQGIDITPNLYVSNNALISNTPLLIQNSGIPPVLPPPTLAFGGYPAGMNILMNNKTTKPIQNIQVGDSVLTASLPGYTPNLDNINSWGFPTPSGVIPPITTNAGTVTKVVSGFITGYFTFGSGWTGSYNNLVVSVTGINNRNWNWEFNSLGSIANTNSLFEYTYHYFTSPPAYIPFKHKLNFVDSGLFVYNLEVNSNKLFFVSGTAISSDIVNVMMHQVTYS